jgi:hypothetical protein
LAVIAIVLPAGHFENIFSFDGAVPVVDQHGVCCVEPLYHFIAGCAAQMLPFVAFAGVLVVLGMRWGASGER